MANRQMERDHGDPDIPCVESCWRLENAEIEETCREIGGYGGVGEGKPNRRRDADIPLEMLLVREENFDVESCFRVVKENNHQHLMVFLSALLPH